MNWWHMVTGLMIQNAWAIRQNLSWFYWGFGPNTWDAQNGGQP